MTRSDHFQETAIERLELALSIPNANVIPVQIAQQSDDRDVRVSVGASLNSTERDNLRQDATATVRVIVDGTTGYVESNFMASLTGLQGDVVDELTQQAAGWRDPSVTNEEEIAWSDSVNRYLGVVEFSVGDGGLHPTYD